MPEENRSARERQSLLRRRRWLLAAMAAVAVYFLIVSLSLRLRLREQQKELAVIMEQIEIAREENDELSRMLSGGEAEYIERIAREKLGYAAIGERVYEDISGID
jgi:cell division protein DivIC